MYIYMCLGLLERRGVASSSVLMDEEMVEGKKEKQVCEWSYLDCSPRVFHFLILPYLMRDLHVHWALEEGGGREGEGSD